MKSFEEREEYIRVDDNEDVMNVNVNRMDNSLFSEEYRSRQPSLFSTLREMQDNFSHESDDGQLGFCGGFGYDLTFQFESMKLHKDLSENQRDLLLHLPDEIFAIDSDKYRTYMLSCDFLIDEMSVTPSTVFTRLKRGNPSPFGFLMNLGEQVYLIGASPEMFVRCEYVKDKGMRVETCPISGTVARGEDALEDTKRNKSIVMNSKEESEITMFSDVERNDKYHMCIPGAI